MSRASAAGRASAELITFLHESARGDVRRISQYTADLVKLVDTLS